jgi:hypothetical protein
MRPPFILRAPSWEPGMTMGQGHPVAGSFATKTNEHNAPFGILCKKSGVFC